MPRLVAFGCSNTYGESLPNPSTQSWPTILASMLDYECVNLAQPGSSARFAIYQMQSFEFQKEDIAVVAWPEPSRNCSILDDGKVKHIGIWHYSKDKQATTLYKQLYTKTHTLYDFKLYDDYARLFFNDKGITYLNYYSAYTYIDGHDEKYRMELLDRGLDDVHPGVESHKYFAERIYKDIKEM